MDRSPRQDRQNVDPSSSLPFDAPMQRLTIRQGLAAERQGSAGRLLSSKSQSCTSAWPSNVISRVPATVFMGLVCLFYSLYELEASVIASISFSLRAGLHKDTGKLFNLKLSGAFHNALRGYLHLSRLEAFQLLTLVRARSHTTSRQRAISGTRFDACFCLMQDMKLKPRGVSLWKLPGSFCGQ